MSSVCGLRVPECSIIIPIGAVAAGLPPHRHFELQDPERADVPDVPCESFALLILEACFVPGSAPASSGSDFLLSVVYLSAPVHL